MSEQCEDCGRFYFEFGEPVRTVQNPNLTGVVIGEREWHEEYQVRLADGLTTAWFKFLEIEPDLEETEENQNVISLAEVRAAKKAGGMH